MALMEYCLVNIVLGDCAIPKPEKMKSRMPPPTSQPKDFELPHHRSAQSCQGDRNESIDSNSPWLRQNVIVHHPTVRISGGSITPATPRTSTADAYNDTIPTLTPAQKRLRRAMLIDRFSRGFFPFLFTLLNSIYWILFYEYL